MNYIIKVCIKVILNFFKGVLLTHVQSLALLWPLFMRCSLISLQGPASADSVAVIGQPQRNWHTNLTMALFPFQQNIALCVTSKWPFCEKFSWISEVVIVLFLLTFSVIARPFRWIGFRLFITCFYWKQFFICLGICNNKINNFLVNTHFQEIQIG